MSDSHRVKFGNVNVQDTGLWPDPGVGSVKARQILISLLRAYFIMKSLWIESLQKPVCRLSSRLNIITTPQQPPSLSVTTDWLHSEIPQLLIILHTHIYFWYIVVRVKQNLLRLKEMVYVRRTYISIIIQIEQQNRIKQNNIYLYLQDNLSV